MRYMNWSWPELMACPPEVIDVIVDIAKKEAAERRIEEAKRAARRRR